MATSLTSARNPQLPVEIQSLTHGKIPREFCARQPSSQPLAGPGLDTGGPGIGARLFRTAVPDGHSGRPQGRPIADTGLKTHGRVRAGPPWGAEPRPKPAAGQADPAAGATGAASMPHKAPGPTPSAAARRAGSCASRPIGRRVRGVTGPKSSSMPPQAPEPSPSTAASRAGSCASRPTGRRDIADRPGPVLHAQ